jgi:molybdate transport system substrate-binding protein
VKFRALAVALAGAALFAAACSPSNQSGSGQPASDGAVSAAPSASAGGSLTVFAAASLKDTFTAIGKQFETDNPGTKVTFNFAGSNDLAKQITQGAPADVFAAASDATMKTVTDAQLTTAAATRFAKNQLEIAVAPGNPKGIKTFADLANPATKVVVCAKGVPCGDAALKVEQATGTTINPVSQETDVKAALSKVASGNADAGLVYVTDVAAAKGQVDGVQFPEAAQAITNYPIAVVKASSQAALAQKFQDAVTGEFGQKTLQAAGFQAP